MNEVSVVWCPSGVFSEFHPPKRVNLARQREKSVRSAARGSESDENVVDLAITTLHYIYVFASLLIHV